MLHRVDFDNVQDDPGVLVAGSAEAIADSQAADAAAVQRNFVNVLTLGQLRGSNGRLERMARLSMWLGNHITSDARADAGFHRRTLVLKAAICTKENVPLGLLDDEELAEGLQALLAATSMEPMLMTSGSAPGGPTPRSDMRAAINMWLTNDAGTESQLATILRSRFATAIACTDAVRSMVGADRAGLSMPVDAATACTAVAAVALRVEARAAADPFGPAALKELDSRMSHLGEMLQADPWLHRSMQERCDHVIVLLQQGTRNEQRGAQPQLVLPQSGNADKSLGGKLGSGSVPRHYQDRVPPAIASASYRSLVDYLMRVFAAGGAAVDLDVLQAAVTGVTRCAGGEVQPRLWVPLIHMMAEGGARGLQADLVDPELAGLVTISRVAWPELLGRAAALQLSVRRNTLHERLVGFCLPEVLEATKGDDFSGLDLGAAYRKVAAALQHRTPPKAQGSPYESRADCADALEVAEVLLTLRGFPGAGPHTIPYILEQVIQTWKLYGGEGSSQTTRSKLAEKGAQYVKATLRRFGLLRSAMMAGKDPNAVAYAILAPE